MGEPSFACSYQVVVQDEWLTFRSDVNSSSFILPTLNTAQTAGGQSSNNPGAKTSRHRGTKASTESICASPLLGRPRSAVSSNQLAETLDHWSVRQAQSCLRPKGRPGYPRGVTKCYCPAFHLRTTPPPPQSQSQPASIVGDYNPV